ncbi:acyltransferase family protein [Bacillus sp. Cs-700]|uniref:acyltransferase family protein n=1 Tax=Bacillus sp. Cs-700 TaxID=2589818 RepID=UPI00140789EA|nr:acyltransferase family protein [Bacillus sp. Cs-700]
MQKTRTGLNEIYFLSAIACLILVGVQVFEMFALKEAFSEIASFSHTSGRFSIAAFAVIVGAFVFHKVRNQQLEKKSFSRSVVSKMILLVALWGSFYFVLMKMIEGESLVTGWGALPFHVVVDEAFYTLSFVIAVLQFLLLYPLLKLVKSKTGWALMLAVSGLTSYFALNGYFSGTTTVQAVLDHPAFLTNWIFFFVFGSFLACYGEKIQMLAKKLNWVGFGIMFVLVGLTVVDLNGGMAEGVWMMVAIPLVTISLLVIYPFVERVVLLDIFLAAIGKSAFGIYLALPVVVFAFSTVMPEFMFGSEYSVLVYSVVLGTTLFISRVIEMFPMKMELKRYRLSKSYGSNGACHHPVYVNKCREKALS